MSLGLFWVIVCEWREVSAGQGFKKAGMSNRLNVVIIYISVAALCSFITSYLETALRCRLYFVVTANWRMLAC